MARKLALIDPDLLTRILNTRMDEAPKPPNPHLKEMNLLKQDMNQALETQGPGTEDEQLRKYNTSLTKYMTQNNQYRDDRLRAVIPPNDLSIHQSTKDPWEEEIVASMPATFRERARLLVRRIKNSGGKVSWNERGELTLSGQPVPGSNIIDLVSDVVRKRKTIKAPPGMPNFTKALGEVNTPRELIGNKDRLKDVYNPLPHAEEIRSTKTPRESDTPSPVRQTRKKAKRKIANSSAVKKKRPTRSRSWSDIAKWESYP